MPNSITAVESTPMMKNFTPASFDLMSPLRNAAIKNPGADTSSSAMNSSSMSRELGIITQPRNDVSSRK